MTDELHWFNGWACDRVREERAMVVVSAFAAGWLAIRA